MFAKIIGSITISPGGSSLQSITLNQSSASVLAYFEGSDELAVAKNNPGLTDYSANDNPATHRQAGNPSFNSFFSYQNTADRDGNLPPGINVLSANVAWNNVGTISTLPAAFTMNAFALTTSNHCPASFALAAAPSATVSNVAIRQLGTSLILDSYNNAGGRTILFTASNVTFKDGTWHMITATYSGGVAKMYIDAVEISGTTNALSGTYTVDTLNFFNAGCTAAPTSATPGVGSKLGPVAFWNTALPQEQITNIWNASGLS